MSEETRGQRIRRLRMGAGLTIQKASHVYDVTPQVVISWELKGAWPSGANLFMLATVYSERYGARVSTDWILGLSTEQEADVPPLPPDDRTLSEDGSQARRRT